MTTGNPAPKGVVLSTAIGSCLDFVPASLKQAQEHHFTS